MRKLVYSIAGAAALVLSSNANAALIMSMSGASGTFGNSAVTCPPGPKPCAFSNTTSFATPIGYRLVGATISSILTGANQATNIDLSAVSLNGTNFVIGSTGNIEFRYLQNLMMSPGGSNTLTISGMSGGNASYAGTLSFAAVPEPSTWLMMIFGIGIVGAGLRRRGAFAALPA